MALWRGPSSDSGFSVWRPRWLPLLIIAIILWGGGHYLGATLQEDPALGSLGGLVSVASALAALMCLVFAAATYLRDARLLGRWGRSAPLDVLSETRFEALDDELPAAQRADSRERSNAELTTVIDLEDVVQNPVQPTAWAESVLHRMEWKRLEELSGAFYRAKGMRTQSARRGSDGDFDICLYQDAQQPQRMTGIVQCKAHARPVGVMQVRELRGTMVAEKLEKAFFFCPAGFNDEARQFAAANRIILLDARLFVAMIQRLPEQTQKDLLSLATAGDWTTPSCPQCGQKMVRRHNGRGPFWGCAGFPACRGTLSMRGDEDAA